jgi:hypothetical protein
MITLVCLVLLYAGTLCAVALPTLGAPYEDRLLQCIFGVAAAAVANGVACYALYYRHVRALYYRCEAALCLVCDRVAATTLPPVRAASATPPHSALTVDPAASGFGSFNQPASHNGSVVGNASFAAPPSSGLGGSVRAPQHLSPPPGSSAGVCQTTRSMFHHPRHGGTKYQYARGVFKEVRRKAKHRYRNLADAGLPTSCGLLPDVGRVVAAVDAVLARHCELDAPPAEDGDDGGGGGDGDGGVSVPVSPGAAHLRGLVEVPQTPLIVHHARTASRHATVTVLAQPDWPASHLVSVAHSRSSTAQFTDPALSSGGHPLSAGTAPPSQSGSGHYPAADVVSQSSTAALLPQPRQETACFIDAPPARVPQARVSTSPSPLPINPAAAAAGDRGRSATQPSVVETSREPYA